MSDERFTTVSIGVEEAYCDFSIIKVGDKIISDGIPTLDAIGICKLLNELAEENEQLKNELRKEKSLQEYSDSMYGADLIVNIRFSNGEWKADVSVIDDE